MSYALAVFLYNAPLFKIERVMSSVNVIEIYAGIGPEGQPVAEQIAAEVRKDKAYQLMRSPAFVKGLASGDIISLDTETGQFELLQRSGNLCIRVFSKGNIRLVAECLTPELEKLGGSLDIETPRMLVYAIHVSCGFDAIETILNEGMQANSMWLYGNVYSQEDGSTPLNWWLDILKPQ
jgi:hypothetical protein